MQETLHIRYPHQKYQADGGPSVADITGLLRRHSDHPSDDIDRFIMALAFNWVIAGTDGHSKNYSLLHSPGSGVRLAPLYDLASFLPYQRDPKSRKVKLAMKIGGTYRLHEIDRRHWEKSAVEAGLLPERVSARVVALVQQVTESLEPTRKAVAEMNGSSFLGTLTQAISERAQKCAEAMR
jgi:serine/threonine-protein kinase HipA